MIPNKDDDTQSKIWSLCVRVHESLGGKYFMDDPHLTEAIQNNEPDTVSKITDCFFKDALECLSAHNSIVGKYLKDGAIQFKPDSYSVFISAVNKEFGELLNDEEEVFILGLHKKVLIMIQLTLWSCINIKCHEYIALALLHFGQMNIHLSDRELWSWLFCFTMCVSGTTICVYDTYATTVAEKKHPSCQVLLLTSSIHRFCFSFIKFGFGHARQIQSSSPRMLLNINPLKTATLHFANYVQGKGRVAKDTSSWNDSTFFYHLENHSKICDDFTIKFSTFLGKHQQGAQKITEGDSHNADSNLAASASVSLRKVVVAPDNTNDAAAALVSLCGTSNLKLFKRKQQVGRMDLVDTDEEEDIESSTWNKKKLSITKANSPSTNHISSKKGANGAGISSPQRLMQDYFPVETRKKVGEKKKQSMDGTTVVGASGEGSQSLGMTSSTKAKASLGGKPPLNKKSSTLNKKQLSVTKANSPSTKHVSSKKGVDGTGISTPQRLMQESAKGTRRRSPPTKLFSP